MKQPSCVKFPKLTFSCKRFGKFFLGQKWTSDSYQLCLLVHFLLEPLLALSEAFLTAFWSFPNFKYRFHSPQVKRDLISNLQKFVK